MSERSQAATQPIGSPQDVAKCVQRFCLAWQEPISNSEVKPAAEDLLAATQWTLAEIARLRKWVSDLQSGMYINCVYCGHRYGPGEITPVSMADALKAHVEKCPAHPMSALRKALEQMVAAHEETLSNSEGRYPTANSGCIECTLGTVPDRLNTGLCAYHRSKELLDNG